MNLFGRCPAAISVELNGESLFVCCTATVPVQILTEKVMTKLGCCFVLVSVTILITKAISFLDQLYSLLQFVEKSPEFPLLLLRCNILMQLWLRT